VEDIATTISDAFVCAYDPKKTNDENFEFYQ